MRDRGAAPKVGEGGGQKVRARQGRGRRSEEGIPAKTQPKDQVSMAVV